MQLEDQLAHIRHQTSASRDNIRVLNAEWSLLNQPTRLDELAKRFLNLTPVTNAKLARLDSLPERPSAAPGETGPVALPAISGLRGAQVANFKMGAER
jgi:hypothetical protein